MVKIIEDIHLMQKQLILLEGKKKIKPFFKEFILKGIGT